MDEHIIGVLLVWGSYCPEGFVATANIGLACGGRAGERSLQLVRVVHDHWDKVRRY